MNSIKNCKNCNSKNSMLKVFSIEYYQKETITHEKNEDVRKPYTTHKDIAIFYICKKCALLDSFKFKEIRNLQSFSFYIVPEDDIKKMEEFKGKYDKPCIYCRPDVYGEKTGTILKFYVETNRRFLGYYCRTCKRAYAIKVNEINWDQYGQKAVINVLESWTNLPTDKVKDFHSFNKETNRLERYVEFIQTPINPTHEGVPIADESLLWHRIGFPKTKERRELNRLQRLGCEIY